MMPLSIAAMAICGLTPGTACVPAILQMLMSQNLNMGSSDDTEQSSHNVIGLAHLKDVSSN